MITYEQAKDIFKKVAFKESNYNEIANKLNIDKSTLCKQMKKYKRQFDIQENETYSAYTYLRFFFKDEIIKAYIEDLRATEDIIKDYNLSDGHIISKILKYYNIPVRSVGYISRTNQKLFYEITNEIEAYTLGLITSDGSISKKYTISITLKNSDRNVLEQINSKLYNNTGYWTYGHTESPETMTTNLVICGKQICENLAKYDIINNKTYLLKHICYFEEPLMQHYLRGLYDGDGVCAKSRNYLRVGYCSYSKEIVKQYQLYFVKNLKMKENKLFNTGGCWHCSWSSRKDLENFYNYIYKDCNIFLARKKDKLYNYLYGNTEVTN